MDNKTLISVAIIEDNHMLRDGLAQLINGTPGFKCVGAFSDAYDIIYRIKRCQPQVVLMDIDIPGKIDGIETTYLLKQDFPDIHIIMQTVFEDKTKIFQAIKAGASGYLLKNTAPARLLEGIQEVVIGGSPMSPSIAYKTLEMFRNNEVGMPIEKPSLAHLTERQRQILECITAGKSYKIIADELFVSIDTVKYHVKNIYDSLQIHSRHELAARWKR
jgi:DNA-binding NarL/FixJ family response regulator